MTQPENEQPGKDHVPLSRTVPLFQLPEGTTAKVAAIDAGCGLNSRLAAMGILPGVEVTVLRNTHPGPFVIAVRNSKIMLGRGVAHKIMVAAPQPSGA